MSKEIWCEVYDRLCEELERDPTDKEMDEAYADHFASLIDETMNNTD